jgi:hypothetical protein
MAMKVGNKMLELLIGVIFLCVLLPLAIAFILATNTTGWNAALVTFWTVGIPAIIVLVGIMFLLEGIMGKGGSGKGRGRRFVEIAQLNKYVSFSVRVWFRSPSYEQ